MKWMEQSLVSESLEACITGFRNGNALTERGGGIL